MVKDLYKKALKSMLVNGEFERLIEYAKTKQEKCRIAADCTMLNDAARNCDIEDIPFIPLIQNIKSVMVLQDVISMMAVLEDKLMNTK